VHTAASFEKLNKEGVRGRGNERNAKSSLGHTALVTASDQKPDHPELLPQKVTGIWNHLVLSQTVWVGEKQSHFPPILDTG
jgi:hypothetical protein